jgi:hypothetical protein
MCVLLVCPLLECSDYSILRRGSGKSVPRKYLQVEFYCEIGRTSVTDLGPTPLMGYE